MPDDPQTSALPERREPDIVTREEYLARGRPMPPMDEFVIEDLTPEEGEAFLAILRGEEPPMVRAVEREGERVDGTGEDEASVGGEMPAGLVPTEPPKRTKEGNVTREEYLSRGRPLPPMEEMVIEDLTPEEGEVFLRAVLE